MDTTEEGKEKIQFECNICLGIPEEPIVASCGHLYWYFYSNSLAGYVFTR